jgi:serine/threonine-protein kinase
LNRPRSFFPPAQTSASKVKALLKYLDARKDDATANRWLRGLNMEREHLDDETKGVPVVALHGALAAFVELTSREAVEEAWEFLIAPDNLAPWMRVLRGTTTPEDAFTRIDADSDYGRTTRWETIEARAGFWRGRVHLGHDPRLEEDGLLGLARGAELISVPALFGFGRGSVVARSVVEPNASELSQEFTITWRVPDPRRGAWAGGGGGAAAGLLVGGLVGGFGIWAGVFLLGAVLGAIVGVVWAREEERRAETRAQLLRVQALERGLYLKDATEREAAGNLEGTVVAGHYKIRQRMGSGASGVIYEAVRISDGVPVAIKLLRAAAAHDATASDRLRREAEALGLAWHPNVVEVIDHGYLADGTAYLVMELLRGESLATRLRESTRLTPAEVLPMALQVCDALVAVHAAGVVHRDLKPSNIFMCPDSVDGTERVKLLDFGIARVEWEETRITNMGSPLGTAGYMSPEQESGGAVDARSDVFSFGAVLYECLVGEPPPSPPATLWGMPSMIPGMRLDSGVQPTTVPPAWREIVEKAIAQKPEDRYQDARSVAIAIRLLRDAESLRPPSMSST